MLRLLGCILGCRLFSIDVDLELQKVKRNGKITDDSIKELSELVKEVENYSWDSLYIAQSVLPLIVASGGFVLLFGFIYTGACEHLMSEENCIKLHRGISAFSLPVSVISLVGLFSVIYKSGEYAEQNIRELNKLKRIIKEHREKMDDLTAKMDKKKQIKQKKDYIKSLLTSCGGNKQKLSKARDRLSKLQEELKMLEQDKSEEQHEKKDGDGVSSDSGATAYLVNKREKRRLKKAAYKERQGKMDGKAEPKEQHGKKDGDGISSDNSDSDSQSVACATLAHNGSAKKRVKTEIDEKTAKASEMFKKDEPKEQHRKKGGDGVSSGNSDSQSVACSALAHNGGAKKRVKTEIDEKDKIEKAKARKAESEGQYRKRLKKEKFLKESSRKFKGISKS